MLFFRDRVRSSGNISQEALRNDDEMIRFEATYVAKVILSSVLFLELL